LVARTSSSSSGSRAAWASAVAGVASVATLPVAIYATRFSERFALLHAALAIPVAGALALVAVALARRARRQGAFRLVGSAVGPTRAGRVLGVAGMCLVGSALVALAVYGLLEYVGSRD